MILSCICNGPLFDASVWVPSLAAIIAAVITAIVSFIILHKQIESSSATSESDRAHYSTEATNDRTRYSQEAATDRKCTLAYTKYQCELQKISMLEEAGIELIKSINPHKFYDLEMMLSISAQRAIEYINLLCEEMDASTERYKIKCILIDGDSNAHTNSLKETINNYQQILRDIQEVIKGTISDSSNAFVDSKLLECYKKSGKDIVKTICSYNLTQDSKVNTIYTNLSANIINHIKQKYQNTESILSE